MKLSNTAYSILKWLLQIVLPAAGTLYLGLDQIWGLPAEEKVTATIFVVSTFLGIVLGISTRNYNRSDEAYDGTMVIMPTPSGGKMHSLELNGDPDTIDQMKSVRFKVDNSAMPPSQE